MMRIDNIASGFSFLDKKMPADSADLKAKSIKIKINDTQKQMRELSSKDELTADEKAAERKKFQKELLGLNARLKQYQEDMQRSQKMKLLTEEQKDKQADGSKYSQDAAGDETEIAVESDGKSMTAAQDSAILKSSGDSAILTNRTGDAEKPKETDESDAVEKSKAADKRNEAGLSGKNAQNLFSADNSVRQAGQVGRVILRTRDGIVILKGEIEQDERYGSDTKRKREELEKKNKTMQRAQDLRLSILTKARNTLSSAVNKNKNEVQANKQSIGQADGYSGEYAMRQNNAGISALRFAAGEQDLQQKFNLMFS